MLVDAKDRAALDEDEGENQLLIGFDSTQQNNGGATPADGTATGGDGGGLFDLDMMLGGNTGPATGTTAPPISNDMMDLFGGGPTP